MKYVCTAGIYCVGKGTKAVCSKCGFEKHEAARRKMIPFEPDENGLMRKVIRRKKWDSESLSL